MERPGLERSDHGTKWALTTSMVKIKWRPCDKSHSVLGNHKKIDYRGKTIFERDHTETMTNSLFWFKRQQGKVKVVKKTLPIQVDRWLVKIILYTLWFDICRKKNLLVPVPKPEPVPNGVVEDPNMLKSDLNNLSKKEVWPMESWAWQKVWW